MKFSLGDLERLFEQIKNIIGYVEATNLKSRRNTLFLANGDTIKYSVPESSIPHLLGINTNYLLGTDIFRSKNSFELMKEMCENPYRIYSLIRDNIIDEKQLFSEHILDKILAFKENIKTNVFETEFVCKYDKNKAYYNSKINENCDYIMVKKYEDGKIGVILLAKNNYLYAPMSNRIYNNIDEAKKYLNDLLTGQEITLFLVLIAYNIEEDYEKKFVLNPFHKKEKFEMLEEYKKMFNCSIDMSNDYKYIANKLREKKDERFENNTTADEIVLAMLNGKIIDRHYYKNSMLISIIDAWNDYICNNTQSNDNGTISYTEVIKALSEAKNLIKSLETKNENLEKQNKSLIDDNRNLISQNKEFEEKEKEIIKILKPEK